jgi:hypothetical protein
LPKLPLTDQTNAAVAAEYGMTEGAFDQRVPVFRLSRK